MLQKTLTLLPPLVGVSRVTPGSQVEALHAGNVYSSSFKFATVGGGSCSRNSIVYQLGVLNDDVRSSVAIQKLLV